MSSTQKFHSCEAYTPVTNILLTVNVSLQAGHNHMPLSLACPCTIRIENRLVKSFASSKIKIELLCDQYHEIFFTKSSCDVHKIIWQAFYNVFNIVLLASGNANFCFRPQSCRPSALIHHCLLKLRRTKN